MKNNDVCLWHGTYSGQICATLHRWITTGGDKKEWERMIRKKRIYEFIFEIKPNLLKKSI